MIYKSNKIDPFFPIIKNYDTTFTQSQKTVYLIFSYLYNKNKPRSIYQFFFYFNSIQITVSNRGPNHKRGGRDRAGNSSQTVLISLFLSLARDRGIFCTTARSTGKKLEQLEPLSGLGDH